jgi:DNA-binding transcriptional MocR family regulator
MTFADLDRSELRRRAEALRARHAALTARKLGLDMTRGKPCPEQLDLSLALLGSTEYRAADATDCRNYGLLDGLPEARQLFAEILEVEPAEIIVGGNSSLALMHDTIVQALLKGMPDAPPWRAERAVKFLCPSPGYDRHFSICERYGIEMLPIEMRDDGPDMDAVEQLAATDPTVKGIWCVPRYSNPTGATYADAVVDRFASMQTAAPDFRIFWDNAYAVHHLVEPPRRLRNILAACRAAGHPDRPLIFTSTSKISFAGAGVAALACSATNRRHLLAGLSMQTIGHDKLNQLRHVRFFKDAAGIAAHMRKHAAILKPKFDAVDEVLSRELGGAGIATWSRPEGGYFISLDVLDGCATRVVAMAAESGVTLTKAGATFPYGKDPRDRNIRLAPSLPSLDEIRQAMELVAVCVQLVSIDALRA